MELKVLKRFRGKYEDKIFIPGDTITVEDPERIGTMISQGFCEEIPNGDNDINSDEPEADKADGSKRTKVRMSKVK